MTTRLRTAWTAHLHEVLAADALDVHTMGELGNVPTVVNRRLLRRGRWDVHRWHAGVLDD